MNNTYKITTSKRVMAIVLLFSQLLTSCVNFNLPNKKEIKGIDRKVNEQKEEIEDPENKLYTTGYNKRISELQKEDLPNNQVLELSVLKPNKPYVIPPKQKENIPPSITSKQTTLPNKQAISFASPESTKDKHPVDKHSLPIALNKHRKLDLRRKEAKDRRIKQNPDKIVNKQILSSITNTSSSTKLQSIAEALVYMPFTSKGGHQIQFIDTNFNQATVKENLPAAFSRDLLLSTYIAPWFKVTDLSTYNIPQQQSHIEVIFPKQAKDREGYVYIGKQGLQGGGNKGSSCSRDSSSDRSSSYSGTSNATTNSSHRAIPSSSTNTTSTTTSFSNNASTYQTPSNERQVRALSKTVFGPSRISTCSIPELPMHLRATSLSINLSSAEPSTLYDRVVETNKHMAPISHALTTINPSTPPDASSTMHASSSPAHSRNRIAENKQASKRAIQ